MQWYSVINTHWQFDIYALFADILLFIVVGLKCVCMCAAVGMWYSTVPEVRLSARDCHICLCLPQQNSCEGIDVGVLEMKHSTDRKCCIVHKVVVVNPETGHLNI